MTESVLKWTSSAPRAAQAAARRPTPLPFTAFASSSRVSAPSTSVHAAQFRTTWTGLASACVTLSSRVRSIWGYLSGRKATPSPDSNSVNARPSMPSAPISSTGGVPISGAGIAGQPFAWDVGQARVSRVLLRQRGAFDGPGDADVGVVPDEPHLGLGVIGVAALVRELHVGADDADAVGKAGRDEQLALVLRRKRHAYPLAEARRADPHVHRHVEHFAQRDADQLRLRVGILHVHPPQHATRRARQVVLHELAGDSPRAVPLARPGLEEISACVAEDVRLEQQHLGQRRGRRLHRCRPRGSWPAGRWFTCPPAPADTVRSRSCAAASRSAPVAPNRSSPSGTRALRDRPPVDLVAPAAAG